MLLPRFLSRTHLRGMLAAVALCAQLIMHKTLAEERSVLLLPGTTGPSNLDPDENTSPTALIDGGFMSMAVSTWKSPDNVHQK